MATPFINARGIELSAFLRYLESSSAEQVAQDLGSWRADPRHALVLGDICRHMLERSAFARAFYAWALAYLERHPEDARERLDLAARYSVLGDLCAGLFEQEAAMDAWAKSIDHGSDDPVPYLRLAQALARAGREEEARARIDGLFALPTATLHARLDPRQREQAEELREILPVAQGLEGEQDLRARVRDLLRVAEQSYGRVGSLAEQRKKA